MFGVHTSVRMHGNKIKHSMDEPVVNSVRGKLNRANDFFPVLVRA